MLKLITAIVTFLPLLKLFKKNLKSFTTDHYLILINGQS